MHEGLEYVIRNMTFSMRLAPLLLRENWKDDQEFRSLRRDVFDNIQSLYQALLRYEMNCVKACHSRRNAIKNLVSWNAWEDQLAAIKEAEKGVDAYMNKYNDEAKKEYLRTVAAHLDAMETDLHALRQSHEKTALRAMTKEQDTLIGKFSVAQNTAKNVADLSQRRNPGTCEWFLQDGRYQEWLRSRDTGVLMVSAPPGCGKSVLSAFLVEEELPLQWPDEQICYHFFVGQSEQRKATNAVRSLLHQILLGYPSIVGHIETDVDREGAPLMEEFEKLGAVFWKAAQTKPAGQVICVLDALDECDPEDLESLLKWLFSVSSSPGSKSSAPAIKFLITSRGLPDILSKFKPFEGSFLYISVQDQELDELLQREIEVVMKDKFLEFSKEVGLDKQPQKRDALWASLKEAGSGQRTYLWVHLVFQALHRTTVKTKAEWESIIKNPPVSIFTAYDKLFRLVKAKEQERVRILLHLVYASSRTRPLTIAEANIATTIHLSKNQSINSQEDLDSEMMMDHHFREWVIQTCGFFIYVYADQLHFFHQTAKEYLRLENKESADAFPRAPTSHISPIHHDGPALAEEAVVGSFRGSVSEQAAQAVAAECCIAYLAMDVLSSNPAYSQERDGLLLLSPEAFADLQFLRYATDNYLAHFRLSQEFRGHGPQSIVMDIDDRFSERYFALWELVSGHHKPALESSLRKSDIRWCEPMAASVEAGQAKLVERHLSIAVDDAARSSMLSRVFLSIGSPRRYPLALIACINHRPELLRWLLDQGANVDGVGIEQDVDEEDDDLSQVSISILGTAVGHCSLDVTKMLLDHGATVDNGMKLHTTEGALVLTPLALALVRGGGDQQRYAKCLLDAGASWEHAVRSLKWMFETGAGVHQLVPVVRKAGFGADPGFRDAARKMGLDPNEPDENRKHRYGRDHRFEA